MSFSEQDQSYMVQAIELAKLGWYTTSPNPRVGCLIVREGEILSQGAHLQAGEGHAEANAIADAPCSLEGATAYVTLEPCSHYGRTGPCAEALVKAKVTRVVVGMVDPNPLVSGRGVRLMQKAGIQVEAGLLEAQCQALNPGFIKRMQTRLPRVRVKMAASLDGKTALANGESKWITSAEARADVQRFRAESCAILSSAETVLADKARLNVRSKQLPLTEQEYGRKPLRQPERVILDGRCRLTGQEPIFDNPDGLIIVRPEGASAPHSDVELVNLPYYQSGFDLNQLLEALTGREYNELWVEAGAALAGAFVTAKLADQLIVYLAPKLMGPDARGLLNLPLQTKMSELAELSFESIQPVGPDVRLIAQVK